jgi:hypothetical protein
MKSENTTCYETAEQNLFTRFETETQGDFLLPYSGLLFARLAPPKSAAAEVESLTLIYVTHTVIITGAKLSALLETFQKGRAETIRIAGWQSNEITPPAVRDIKVTEGNAESQPT